MPPIPCNTATRGLAGSDDGGGFWAGRRHSSSLANTSCRPVKSLFRSRSRSILKLGILGRGPWKVDIGVRGLWGSSLDRLRGTEDVDASDQKSDVLHRRLSLGNAPVSTSILLLFVEERIGLRFSAMRVLAAVSDNHLPDSPIGSAFQKGYTCHGQMEFSTHRVSRV